MNSTTGRTLALNLAAATDRETVHRLIQGHLDTLDRDEALLVLAVALATLAGNVLMPAVDRMGEADEWRAKHTEAVRQIVGGPTERKEN